MDVCEETSSMNISDNQTNNASYPSGEIRPLFTILKTPVKVKPGFFANLLALWDY